MIDPYTRHRAAYSRTTQALNAMLALMRDNDPASPTSATTDPSGSGPSDPTENQALDRTEPALLTRIASAAEQIADEAERHLQRLTPRSRTPSKPCDCCQDPDRLATHTRSIGTGNDRRRFGLCWWCLDFLRRNGHLCTADIHDGRPSVRMCECWCCRSCPDRAAEGRTVSERCRTKQYRERKREREAS